MDQPLDFSNSKINNSSLKMKQQLQLLKEFNRSNDYHLNNSENSDGNLSRSSASSPDCLENEQKIFDQTSFNQQQLFMLTVPNLLNGLNSSTNLSTGLSNGFTNGLSNNFIQNFNNNPQIAAAMSMFGSQFNNSNVNQLLNNPSINYQTESSTNKLLNKSNQTKKSKTLKLHMINRQKSSQLTSSTNSNQTQLSSSNNQTATQLSTTQTTNQTQLKSSFDLINNSQNSTNSFKLNNSLQYSVNSNLSNEDSLHEDSSNYSPDDSPSAPRRRRGQPIPDSLKDDGYWTRRRKNNEAAKKSRDLKRAKDLITARRASSLEQENLNLRNEINQIRNENLILKSILGDQIFFDSETGCNLQDLIKMGSQLDTNRIKKFAEDFREYYSKQDQKMEV